MIKKIYHSDASISVSKIHNVGYSSLLTFILVLFWLFIYTHLLILHKYKFGILPQNTVLLIKRGQKAKSGMVCLHSCLVATTQTGIQYLNTFFSISKCTMQKLCSNLKSGWTFVKYSAKQF